MGWRQIEVNGKNFRWKCGGSFVVIQDDNGKRIGGPSLQASSLKENCSPYDWERGHWKRTTDGMLRPREVANFITKQMRA